MTERNTSSTSVVLACSCILALALASPALAIGTNCGSRPDAASFAAEPFPPESSFPSRGVKVAYLGDEAINKNSVKVLEMVKNWNADFLIHAGDFDYVNNPKGFLDQVDSVFGADFPYFATIGNHDVPMWGGAKGYQARLVERLEKSGADKACTGEFGVNMACHYKGIAFVLSGVGTRGANHAKYIEGAFENFKSTPWKVCAWHKNQRVYQTGSKSDEVGYEAYETCRRFGAMISTGHEHSYSRSHLMSDYTRQVVKTRSNTLALQPGQSFVFVSGVAGREIREWKNKAERNPWWAVAAASDNNLNYGAVLCEYKSQSEASCEFRDIAGKVWDSFQLTANPTAAAEDTVEDSASPGCDARIPFLEYQVAASEDDVYEDLITGRVITDTANLLIAADSKTDRPRRTGLRFRNVALPRNARIHTAHLQIFGKSDPAQLDTPVRMVIRAERGASAPFEAQPGSVTSRPLTAAYAEWTNDVSRPATISEDEWERDEVWISTDLKTVLEEVSRSSRWEEGADLSLIIDGFGAAREGYAFDASPCVAPSLVIELESECNGMSTRTIELVSQA